MPAPTISLEDIIERTNMHIKKLKKDGRHHVKITFEGNPLSMNQISFGRECYIIEESEVSAFCAAVKEAGGTPWDYYADIEFSCQTHQISVLQ